MVGALVEEINELTAALLVALTVVLVRATGIDDATEDDTRVVLVEVVGPTPKVNVSPAATTVALEAELWVMVAQKARPKEEAPRRAS